MKSLLSHLHSKFHQAAQKAFPESHSNIPTEVTVSTQAKFGHYQCNTAMKLTKALKQPPQKIAEQMIQALDRSDGMISQLEIAGPGFINITLDPAFLSKETDILLRYSHLGIDPPETTAKDHHRFFFAECCQGNACGTFAVDHYRRLPGTLV